MLEIFCISCPKAYRAINKHTQMVCLKQVNISMSFKKLNFVIKSISEIPKYRFYDIQVPNGKEGCSKNELWSGGYVKLQKHSYFTLNSKGVTHFCILLLWARFSKSSPEDWQKSIFSAWKNHYHKQFFNQWTGCHSLLQQLVKAFGYIRNLQTKLILCNYGRTPSQDTQENTILHAAAADQCRGLSKWK